MHGVPNEKGPIVVTGEELKPVLEKAGLQIPEPLIQDYSTLLTGLEAAISSLPDDKTVQPRPDLQKYPRADIHIPAPENSDFGAWATKVCSSFHLLSTYLFV
jgi:amidase